MNLKRKEAEKLAARTPSFEEMTASLHAGPRLARGMIRETRDVVAYCRKFCDEVVRPQVLELDRGLHEDPDHLPWDFVKKANEWGFYSLWIPRLLGGHGVNFSSLSYAMEEIGSVCLAMANLIGVHYLGFGTLTSSGNARLMRRLAADVVAGEKSGEPCLISLAITEPGAGTDVEEVDLVDKANLGCQARRVDGGYEVNGSKVFISNGHLSTWHMVISYSDLARPSETTVMMAVKTGMKGFSFGRHEKKMGQRACPASELVFNDCFVPDELVALDDRIAQTFTRSQRETGQQMIDYVVSTSRAAVGAFGVGAARGAYEAALKFASETVVDGELLVNHEWAQCWLAEMLKNVTLGRLAYAETNYANGLYGMFKLLHEEPMFSIMRLTPRFIYERYVAPLLEKPGATAFYRKRSYDGQSSCEQHRTSGLASIAKFAGTDFGIKNCQMALAFMGEAGLRQDRGAEKHLRDAKLLQIYEGTNQLNRLNLFKCLIACGCDGARVFEEKEGGLS